MHPSAPPDRTERHCDDRPPATQPTAPAPPTPPACHLDACLVELLTARSLDTDHARAARTARQALGRRSPPAGADDDATALEALGRWLDARGVDASVLTRLELADLRCDANRELGGAFGGTTAGAGSHAGAATGSGDRPSDPAARRTRGDCMTAAR